MGRGREGKGRERAEGGDRVGKGEGGIDLDICPASPRVPSYATALSLPMGLVLSFNGINASMILEYVLCILFQTVQGARQPNVFFGLRAVIPLHFKHNFRINIEEFSMGIGLPD